MKSLFVSTDAASTYFVAASVGGYLKLRTLALERMQERAGGGAAFS